jgi:hypothetical protein
MPLSDWNARLLTPERALRLTGDWPFYHTLQLARLSQFEMEGGGGQIPDQWQVNLRCGKPDCMASITMVLATRELDPDTGHAGNLLDVGTVMSAVLRHLVTAHDVSLSGSDQDGRRNPPDGNTGPGTGSPGTAGHVHSSGSNPGLD